MRERSIIFHDWEVRATLDGRKTQFCRPIKNLEMFGDEHDDGTCDLSDVQIAWTDTGHSGPGWYAWSGEYPDEGSGFVKCPYGLVGDRLWVREKWCQVDARVDPNRAAIYAADGDAPSLKTIWTPSIHMPRWASRITLEVTCVRVKRVQEITEEDAKAEGVEPYCDDGAIYYPNYLTGQHPWHASAKESFRTFWDSINAASGFGWDANPWVWVIDFKKVSTK